MKKHAPPPSFIHTLQNHKKQYSFMLLNLLSSDTLNQTEQLIEQFKEQLYKQFKEQIPPYFIISHDKNIFNTFTNKWYTKQFLQKIGLPTTPGILLNGRDHCKKIFSYDPIYFLHGSVIKETSNTGGQGIYYIKTYDDIDDIPFLSNKQYIIEPFLSGQEYSGSLFVYSNPKNEQEKNIIIFPAVAKGHTGINSDNTVQHALTKIRTSVMPDNTITKRIQMLTQQIGKIPGIQGFCDIDFICNEQGELQIIEINPRISGITQISLTSCGYDIQKIIQYIKNTKKRNTTISIPANKYMVEYPICHQVSNFEESTQNIIPQGCTITSRKCLRKFPPFLEILLLEFENKQSAQQFLDRNT